MYVCGVTVYDLSHIGHARSAIVFDVIRRYLLFKGYRVKFVRNYTDVDDRIIRRANADGVPAHVISERYITEFQVDMASLGVLPGDVEPKATEHVPQMVTLIERLIAGGFAYVVDGDVYFEVRSFPEYGKLSGRNLEELLAGARVEIDERKRDPRDFALWKSAKPGEPWWPSPWGRGARAGTSSARRCRCNTWANLRPARRRGGPRFRIMSARSLSRRRRRSGRSSKCGCTTGS